MLPRFVFCSSVRLGICDPPASAALLRSGDPRPAATGLAVLTFLIIVYFAVISCPIHLLYGFRVPTKFSTCQTITCQSILKEDLWLN